MHGGSGMGSIRLGWRFCGSRQLQACTMDRGFLLSTSGFWITLGFPPGKVVKGGPKMFKGLSQLGYQN